jgi:hypothetical protein
VTSRRRSAAALHLAPGASAVGASLGVVLGSLVACSAEEDLPRNSAPVAGAGMPAVAQCLAGEVRACPCTGGAQGVQSCDATGVAFGACACPMGSIAQLPVGGGSAPTSVGQSGSTGAPGTAGISGTPSLPIGGSNGATNTMPPEPTPREAPLAGGIRIKELAIYQAVKVPLSNGGDPVIARNAPVVIGKEAFLRVFVEPMAGWQARELDVELNLVSAEGPAKAQTLTARVMGASSDSQLTSTINFDIPGDQITADLKYSVALHEKAGAATMGTVDAAARFPQEADSLIDLGARDAGPLRVMLVPWRYTADGSNRLPATDQKQLDLLKSILHAYYPADDIQIELHEPVDYNQQLGPNTGWEQWLTAHCALRQDEDPDPKLLYYGVMAPRETLRAYGSGVVGISNLPSAAANYGRCSVGVGWAGNITATTMAHELGHSLGLPHAPCGVNGGPFPYPEASIGVWGYSLSSKMLRDPGEYKDLMSYCDPSFISDYNFEKIFERIRYLNLQFDELMPRPTRYARVLVDRFGRASFHGSAVLKRTPGGLEEERPLTVLDAGGRALAGARTGYYFPYSEQGAGLWLVPDDGAVAVEIEGLGRVQLQ